MTTVQSKVIAPWSNELFQCQGDPSIGMSYGEGMSWVCVRRAYVSRAGRTMARETRRTTFSSRLRLGSGWTGSVVVLSCPFKLRDVTHFIASSVELLVTLCTYVSMYRKIKQISSFITEVVTAAHRIARGLRVLDRS